MKKIMEIHEVENGFVLKTYSRIYTLLSFKDVTHEEVVRVSNTKEAIGFMLKIFPNDLKLDVEEKVTVYVDKFPEKTVTYSLKLKE